MAKHQTLVLLTVVVCHGAGSPTVGVAQWQTIYHEPFDNRASGARTGEGDLAHWEGGSAAGIVYDGSSHDAAAKFLVADHSWSGFNQGPILNIQLERFPHDRVRVRFDLYTFGDWRGNQEETGGPQHRLMFFDATADPRFAFDTTFSTNSAYLQAWPDRNPSRNSARVGGRHEPKIDLNGRYQNETVWPVCFEYPSSSTKLRFTFLSGAAAGSGPPLPPFAIDNVRLEVRRTTIPPFAPYQNEKSTGTTVTFETPTQARNSLAVFDQTGRLVRELTRGRVFKPGRHNAAWDGLDQTGNAVPPGNYEWRLLKLPEFRARFVTTLGVNPPSGRNGRFQRNWVGDHLGAGTVCVDDTGVYIGATFTEGGMQTLKQSHDGRTRYWEQPQYYDGGQMTRMTANGRFVYLIQPNGNLRKLDAATGALNATWNVRWNGEPAADLDAAGNSLVACFPGRHAVRWLDGNSGRTLDEITGLTNVRAVSLRNGRRDGDLLVLTDEGVVSINRQQRQGVLRIPARGKNFVALDVDHSTGDLYLADASDKVQVRRFNSRYQLVRSYGGQARSYGKYDPSLFWGVSDVAADGRGGFYITEPANPPRRTARFDVKSGALIEEWYGGQSFYVHIAADPDDPSSLWGCAAEGCIHHYRMDYGRGTWSIQATYQIGRLGDSLYPFTAKWRPFHRNGQTYLLCASLPAMVRVDEDAGRLIPVAIAGCAHNGPRTFSMFPGTGERNFPKPWVAAARHHGFQDLNQASRYYYWGDGDGDGKLDPDEFRFFDDHPEANTLSTGVYDKDLHFYKPQACPGNATAACRLPRTGWIGPNRNVPVWEWTPETIGRIPAVVSEWPSLRSVSRSEDGSFFGAVQSGVMIREHGQFEGGRWPYQSLKRVRLVKWSPEGRELFCVGRLSKSAHEMKTGVFYHPMRLARGPNRTIIVGDQVHQMGTVWSDDGLYAGGLLDQRADDGLADSFYQTHSDDMQGVELVQLADGRVFWLQSVQGMVLVYEIEGFDRLTRQSGVVMRPAPVREAERTGTGLTAIYYNDLGGKSAAFKSIEAPLYFDRFGGDPHANMPDPPHRIVWEGFLEVPTTDRYELFALLGSDESVVIDVAGKTVFTADNERSQGTPVSLAVGRSHPIKINYVNRKERCELKVLWSSLTMDRRPLDQTLLYPQLP